MAYAVFIIASAALFHILLGYPVLLALSKGRRLPAVAKDPNYTPQVSAIVAVYNGAAQMRAKLDTLFALDYPARLLQIIADEATRRVSTN